MRIPETILRLAALALTALAFSCADVGTSEPDGSASSTLGNSENTPV